MTLLKDNPYKCAFLILLAILTWASFSGCGSNGKGTGRAVILISIDTLRPDHLGCYGYKRNTSPNIDRFAAQDALLFTRACAQAPYTLPSHMSMLTGLYPETHGVLMPIREDGSGKVSRLSDEVVTLAERFKKQGYVTAAFTDGLLVDHKYGFDQGFDEYHDKRDNDPRKNGFRRWGKKLREWIDRHSDNDFFLFVHSYDTHSPYPAPSPFHDMFRGSPPAKELPSASLLYARFVTYHNNYPISDYRDLQDVVDVYDGCIRYVDNEIGILFQHLKERGLWKKSLIVFTSDHGELFMENGLMIGHGLDGYNELIFVPLLIKLPHSVFSGGRIDHVVESVDIAPTMLNALHLPVPDGVQGQDIMAGVREKNWRKEYGFGISPNTGFNHYLYVKDIKFIEAVHDPTGRLMRGHLKPIFPPGFTLSAKLMEKTGKKGGAAYTFDRDPLGLAEVFERGDRLYDMHEYRYEWQAPEIRDPERIKKYKRLALTLAMKAVRENGKFQGSIGQESLNEEDRAQLNALGYAGVLNTTDTKRRGYALSDPKSFTVKLTAPLVDRTLMNRGDRFLWKVYRVWAGKEKGFDPGTFEKELDKSRACYEQFLSKYPDKKQWCKWRLKCLEYAEIFWKKGLIGRHRR